MKKKRVLIIVGGRSGEHEISLISGKYVLQALDRKEFEPLILIIQKNGVMTLGDETEILKLPDNPRKVKTPQGTPVLIAPYKSSNGRPSIQCGKEAYEYDIAFPILHGPGGEDGTIQGMFELAEIPVVGSGVKASAICMDKVVTKRLCMQAHLPVVPFVETYRGEELLKLPFPFPVFVKPAHLGSSLGVSKVKKEGDLQKALDEAFQLDDKVLVEPGIEGREIEISVLGKRGDLTVSLPGEIKCKTEFYSYDAKYVDSDSAELIMPAAMEAEQLSRLQDLSRKIFLTLDCKGMARIDYFMTSDGNVLLNEVNTIPGFTPISMYPKLLQLVGISYPDLIHRLISLA